MLVGAIRGIFFVPRYQRGYRWDTSDVGRLLDDIWENGNNPYSLQPVVVKLLNEAEAPEPENQQWELIDGQQRLTTLYLIFLYIQSRGWRANGAPYKIRYETRPGCAAYLENITEDTHQNNIDYFHIYKAYECIGIWFEKHGDRFVQEDIGNQFHGYLYRKVDVIWYHAKENNIQQDSTALFTRLNIGRIPLTDAELVKALLLAQVRKKISLERASELAAHWDNIERDLRDPDIWAFVAGNNQNRVIDKYQTRINLLLDTLAGTFQGNHPRYHTFDTLRKQIDAKNDAKIDVNPITFWNSVVELHALIIGWYNNPSLYNKIGFLVANHKHFGDLVNLAKNQRKKDFENLLTQQIKKELNTSAHGLMDLDYDKPKHHKKLLELLLLMNVETVSRTGNRFPFRRHIGKTWSLEHIHAQNSESLTKLEQWKTWLNMHKKALQTLPEPHDVLVKEIDTQLLTIDNTPNFGNIFPDLAGRVINEFNGATQSLVEDDLHAITNLALLSSGDNSALSNAVFEVKRQNVLTIDRNLDGSGDGYIPVCTRNVFLKYYTGADAQQIHFWSPQDKKSYYNAIVAVLRDYLQPSI